MPDQPEKLDLRSMDLTEEKKHELLTLFPEIRTEGGKIDFERLKLALGEMVDVGKERYGMNWPGKAECFRTIHAPAWGATAQLIAKRDALVISIHAPAWGAPTRDMVAEQGALFQSTLPHGERPDLYGSQTPTGEFQSTLPHGERPNSGV